LEKLKNLLSDISALEDQTNLFENTLFNELYLDSKYKKYVAYSAALALKDENIINLLKQKIGSLTNQEKKAVTLASSRMAVTNPYFMSRNIAPLQAGGTLESLYMRAFPTLEVEDEVAYHYACIAISIINKGYVCFNSHLQSLKSKKQSDLAIDQAIRLVSSVHCLKQLYFNESVL